MDKTERILEFDQIKEMLAEHALSREAKETLLALAPLDKESVCRIRMEETTAARHILETFGAPPLSVMAEMGRVVSQCDKDAMLLPEQLESVSTFIVSCQRLAAYLKKAEELEEAVGGYGRSIEDLSGLRREIDHAIRNGMVDNGASPALSGIRRKLENARNAIRAKLDALLHSKRQWFSDGFISTRNGYFVLPVKREYKNQMSGTVVDMSSTGSTCFMEPSSVSKLRGELDTLQVEEDNEVRKILYALTAAVDDCLWQIKRNREAMETVDVLFAKAKFSLQLQAAPARFSEGRQIDLRQARHPLLDSAQCVPLDIAMGGDVPGICITGPNTGGKTVALKTVGLLSVMAQCGLHIPAAEGCTLAMARNILCDIGDGQSISENLSTFSAHMTRIINILDQTGPDSLVLLDELGSGTDPAEGMGIAVAVLDELQRRGCLFIVTTHYPEVKEYARAALGMTNARMAFDRESLQPLFRLEIGEAGESCALHIARRLGFPDALLERAHQAAYGRPTHRLPPAQTILPPLPPSPPPPARKVAPKKEAGTHAAAFRVGDSVTVYPGRETGIVCRGADERGELSIQVKGKKISVGHKRVKLQVPASELYPPDYDFSIVFDSVEDRKARHRMEKGHQPGLVISYGEDQGRDALK